MSKEDFRISFISSSEAAPLLNAYHYLTGISKGFNSGQNFGLFYKDVCCGVCIFTGFPVPELAVGMFGLPRDEQEGLWELSRLVLAPSVQEIEHNLASWFVSRSVRMLRANNAVKAILSYADASFHKGTVYRACNFKYYGLTAVKSDFWIAQTDGSFIKHSRGKMKGVVGEWRPRTQKHRFVLCFDKKLKIKWVETNYLTNYPRR